MIIETYWILNNVILIHWWIIVNYFDVFLIVFSNGHDKFQYRNLGEKQLSDLFECLLDIHHNPE